MGKAQYIALADRVLFDQALYPSAKRVLVAMLGICSPAGFVRRSIGELAAASHCCPATVCRAIDQLSSRGYLRCARNYRFCPRRSRVLFDKNCYKINKRMLQGSYTLIPMELLDAPVSHGVFVVALYLYKCAGRSGRACPSLRHTGRSLDLSKSTVCRAIALLSRLQAVARLRCVKANRAHSCNSYYPTAWVRPGQYHKADPAKKFALGGGPIFSKPPVINKITGDYHPRERKKGVREFGNMHNSSREIVENCPFYFDGIGIRVSAAEEQILAE